MRTSVSWRVALSALLLLVGCGSQPVVPSGDAGSSPTDAASLDDAFVADASLDDAFVADASLDPLDVDDDEDGTSESQGDCDDTNAAVGPSAVEICDNEIDDDCDSVVDDTSAAPTLIGPTAYLQASDGPWNDEDLESFTLVDFEDQTIPAGVTLSDFTFGSGFSLAVVDSVDGDDGDPTNGTCNPCESVWSGSSLTITFDGAVLGGLPTHVGFVLTDAFAADVNVTVSAQSSCATLGDVTSSVTFGDGSIGGETAEDRFVGVESPAGISSITIAVGGAFEIDHLQFGR